ncbi:MAG: two-component system, NtrC family, response regulator AtoC [Acidobacteriota bacterium]|nr:two-component system, NtrC family, response regulator AtoC [Acidobacteriota bacterium]
MNLTTTLLHQIDEIGRTPESQAQLRCALAQELDKAGSYETARQALGALWQGIGVRPALEDFELSTQAVVLLRVGVLSGWLGSAHQVVGAQDAAKDLISESMSLFSALGESGRATEAEIELAWCYWREGCYDEARVTLRHALDGLPDAELELKGIAQVRLAEVERSAARHREALTILLAAAALIKDCESYALKGKFHSTLAGTWESLGVAEKRPDYIDNALIELTAASFHLEQAGHTHYLASVENNLGFSLFRAGRFDEAYDHLERARRLFVRLKDGVRAAQVDETRARALLAQGCNAEAERIVRAAVKALERGDEQALLAEALITHGIALTRLARRAPAREAFQRAVAISEQLNDREGAGVALLTIFEELAQDCALEELQALYVRADELLSQTQQPELLSRLRACARRLIMPPVKAERLVEFSTLKFVHNSEKTGSLLQEANAVARGQGSVLLSGETGTGKDVLARLIHEWSGRGGRFVALNCAALCDTLVESQLFGHKKGSFTDAAEDYAGTALEAEGGTLFLDEIGELSLAHQAKLLRLIDHGEIYPVGSALPVRVNVRIIAATNHDLRQRVSRGLFRADLFYRLNTFHLELPPLRERPEDIPALAEHFIAEARKRYHKQLNFTPESLAAMSRLPLRGNARELRILIERTFITTPEETVITAAAVETVAHRQTNKSNFAAAWSGCSLEEEVRAYERNLIRLALDSAGGSITRAARLLNVTHQGLAYIVNGRHNDLLALRKPTRTRRVSLMRPENKVKSRQGESR